jgi:hypothetical protein
MENPLGALAVFLWSLGAGFAISVLDYAGLANVPRRQRRVSFTDPAYLFKFFGHPVIGAFLASAYAQSQPATTPLIPILIGAAAPTIWRTIARSGRGIAKILLKELAADESESN